MRQSNCQSRTANKRLAGITLVEIMVGTAIIFIALLPLMYMMNYAIKNIVFSSKSSIASKLAQELMNEILARPRWDENANPGKAVALSAATVSAALGPDVPETYPDFNDIDDYDEVVIPNVPIGKSVFQRSVIVEYVTVDDATGAINPFVPRRNFKRITVSVTWAGNDKKPVTISTIAANVDKY